MIAADNKPVDPAPGGPAPSPAGPTAPEPGKPVQPQPPAKRGLRRFYGTVTLDPSRVGRDAGRIADEVISHLSGMVGANVTVTLEINAQLQEDIPDNVVRTVLENARTLKFSNQGFEES